LESANSKGVDVEKEISSVTSGSLVAKGLGSVVEVAEVDDAVVVAVEGATEWSGVTFM
jgi:hypothetical protein